MYSFAVIIGHARPTPIDLKWTRNIVFTFRNRIKDPNNHEILFRFFSIEINRLNAIRMCIRSFLRIHYHLFFSLSRVFKTNTDIVT